MNEIILIISVYLASPLGLELLRKGRSLKKKSLIWGGILCWVYVLMVFVLQTYELFAVI